MRQMTLVGFLQAQTCTNFVGSWRHPLARQDFTSAEYYRRIGRALEAGKFHLGIFDDRLAMPDLLGGDHAHTVANGIRCGKMDPITILTAMGMATEHLGLGATFSTTYFEPFHVAPRVRHPGSDRPGWWFPNCNAAGCSIPTTQGLPCVRTLAWTGPKPAPGDNLEET